MDTSAPPAGIPTEDWAATPVAVQQFRVATRTVVTLQQQQIAQLLARVADLVARLHQHAQNSSKIIPSGVRAGARGTADCPADRPARAFGPRTAAVVRLRHGRDRSRHREVVTLLADLFQLPLSLGRVVTLHTTVSTALAPLAAAIHTHVQAAPVANVDATGGQETGKRRWVWGMVTALASCFAVATSRNSSALRQLLGPP